MTSPIGDLHARTRLRIAAFLVAAVVLSVLYALAIGMLERRGVVSPGLAFFAEKAALAKSGLPPRLINVGFVYPLLSYLLLLPFPTALIGQAAIGGITIAAVLDFLGERVTDRLVRWTARLFVLVSPVVIYLATEDASTLLLAVLLAVSVHHITHFLRTDYSLDLFIGSTLLGLTFFLDFRSAALLLAIVPAAVLPLWRDHRSQAISVGLTLTVPTLFLTLAWSYVNWIFLGDPFAFVTGRGSIFRTFPITPALLAAAGDPVQTLRTAGAALLFSLPVTLPYFTGFAFLRRGRASFTIPMLVTYASPLLFVIFAIFGGLYRPTVGLLALFLFVFIFSVDAMRRSWVLALALVIGLIGSCVAPFASPDAGERTFADVLFRHEVAPDAEGLGPYRAIAARLGSEGRILMDDAELFPLVDVLAAPGRLVLPYQYEFASAASNPGRFVRYVVVARRPEDSLYALYPGAEFGHLPNFHEILRLPGFIVFERDAR
jgi:hypothetical protein